MGINDLKAIPLFPEERDEIVSNCLANIEQMVAAAQSLGATVIVSTILPAGEVPLKRRPVWSDEVNRAAVAVNEAIALLADEDTVVFDAYGAIADGRRLMPDAYRSDELHLNQRGYAALNQAFVAVLARMDNRAAASRAIVSTASFIENAQSIAMSQLGQTAFSHDATVHSASFSPDGQFILTGSTDGTAALWRTDGEQVKQFTHSGPVVSVNFSPDGQSILTGSLDGIATLWHVSGDCIRQLQHPGPVVSVSFSPDGRSMLTGSSDGTALLWDIGDLAR